MDISIDLPDDFETLKAAFLVSREQLAAVTSELANARAKNADDAAFIAHLKFEIAKYKRQIFGAKSERTQRLLDQLELQLEDAEANATEDELRAEAAASKTASVQAFVRKRPGRKPFPADLPRERVVVPGPVACACCGSRRLCKLGEDVTETIEVIPRQWRVIQTVREKFSCRDCETIDQAPAPFHVTPRGFAGPNLLAMILFEKFGQHQPLNRQSDRYALEGIDLSVSTLADQVGACAFVLQPLAERLEQHVFAATRLHGDDTTVPVLAKSKTDVGRLWTYVRDDRPFAGNDPPAAMFYYSRNRKAEHPNTHLADYKGILQVDAYSGYNDVFAEDCRTEPLTAAFCWAHARREFFKLADVEAAANKNAKGKHAVIAPLALEALRRIDELFAIEREINGKTIKERYRTRQELSAPLVHALEQWMTTEKQKLSRHSEVAKAMDYMLRRWAGFAGFLNDGRICLSNNAAERALRGIALGRKAWLFCGSDRGGHRAALMYSLIITAKLNGVDPQAWLADVLARINSYPVQRIDELLPWNWNQNVTSRNVAA